MKAWEMSQAYKVFKGDLYVQGNFDVLTQELRPKV